MYWRERERELGFYFSVVGAGAIIGIRRSAAVAVAVTVIGRDGTNGCARRGEAVLAGGGKIVTGFNGGAQRREAAARNCNGHF